MRMLPGYEGQSYRERLGSLGLCAFECKRWRGDFTHKIMGEIHRVHPHGLLPKVDESRAMGHRFKVRGEL